MLLLQHLVVVLVIFGGCLGVAQTFDAASVKTFDLREERRGMAVLVGGPGSKDPGRLHYPGATMEMLLLKAYDVTSFQLQGPDWIRDGLVRFSIDATLPPDTTPAQFRAMLRNLLAERFHLATHTAQKEVPGYELTAGKKLKLTASSGPAAPANDGER